MDTAITWFNPIILLPGIALFLLSLTNRYSALMSELHTQTSKKNMFAIPLLKKRLHCLNTALYFCYASLIIFCIIAGMDYGTKNALLNHTDIIDTTSIVSSLLSFMIPSIFIIIDIYLANKIMQSTISFVKT